MNPIVSTRFRPGYRSRRLILIFVVLAGLAAFSQPHAARAHTPLISGAGSVRNYHLTGSGSVALTYDNPEGQSDIERCFMSFVPIWKFNFDGTLDTFTQTLKGSIDVPNDKESGSMHCGPKDPSGIIDINPIPGDGDQRAKDLGYQYKVFAQNGTFSGTYDDKGNFTLLGRVALLGRVYWQGCADRGKVVRCFDLGYSESAIEPGTTPMLLGTHAVQAQGRLSFSGSEPGVAANASLVGRIDLPDSSFGHCCLMHQDDGVPGAWRDLVLNGAPTP